MKSILIGMLAAVLAAGAQNNEAERQLKAAGGVLVVDAMAGVAVAAVSNVVGFQPSK